MSVTDLKLSFMELTVQNGKLQSGWFSVLIKVLQGNRINDTCTYTESCFKELTHVFMEAGKSRIIRVG